MRKVLLRSAVVVFAGFTLWRLVHKIAHNEWYPHDPMMIGVPFLLLWMWSKADEGESDH